MKNLEGITIVGAGPVAYSLLSSIRSNGYNGVINIFTGISFTDTQNSNNFKHQTKNISPKLLQDFFIRSIDTVNYKTKDFFHINTIGIGGGSRFWGASLSAFNKDDIEKNHMNYEFYKNNLKKVIEFFGKFNTNISSLQSKISQDSSKIFLDNAKNIIISDVFLAVDGQKCIGCGMCLKGCKERAIWEVNKNNFDELNVNIIDDYIQVISAVDGQINTLCGISGSRYKLTGDIFLAANPVSNFKILARLTGVNHSSIGCTPAFVFAIPRLFVPKNLLFFGMAQRTFRVIENNGKNIAYGNIYDGKSLSFRDIPIFQQNENIFDYFKKFFTKFFWLGAGFISSENFKCKLILVNEDIKFEIISDKRNLVLNKIKEYLKKSVSRNFVVYFKKPLPGSDLHYCDGIPEDLSINPDSGRVAGYSNLYVVGASNFKFIPSNSPTLSYMANAYGVGILFAQSLSR